MVARRPVTTTTRPSALEEAAHQLTHQGAARDRVDGDGGEPCRPRRVGVHAQDGDAALVGSADEGLELVRLAGGDDEAVDVVLQRALEGLLLSFPEVGIEAVEDLDPGALQGARRVLDAVADEVPERRDLAGQGHRDAELLAGRQVAGGQVGPIPERLRGAKHAGPGFRADSRTGRGARGRRFQSRRRASSRSRECPGLRTAFA